MVLQTMDCIDLSVLVNGAMPGITSHMGGMLAEAAAVCLQDQKHQSGVEICIVGMQPGQYVLQWAAINAQHKRTYNDLQEATEFGACGIAISLIQKMTGDVVVERSRKGSGFDYWLAKDEDDLLFGNNKHRLEVSGILQNKDGRFEARIKQKQQQISVTKDLGPGFVAVIEFGDPKAHVGLA